MMKEVEEILQQENITDYKVIEDRHERGIHRVTVLKADGRTLQVNVSDTKYEVPKYEVVEERHENGAKKVTLRMADGRTAYLTIPDHTAEEEAKIAENFTRAAYKMIFPNDDWSHTDLKIII